MSIKCLFCDLDVTNDGEVSDFKTNYMCKCCGPVRLIGDAPSGGILDGNFSEKEKNAISITLRNEWERGGRNPRHNIIQRTLDDLRRIADQLKPLDPLEKMDNVLINIEKCAEFAGAWIDIDFSFDYPYYYCKSPDELRSVIDLLTNTAFIELKSATFQAATVRITSNGYHRLRETQRQNQESRQCFVAMWFAQEMDEAFDKAIKPAIEFVEPGDNESKFKAIKIDNVEHLNDINDEIIAQIRRSRFIVCDLTGYRGGVYFEAGFAYGLGLDVIYTCRKDWTRAEILKDTNDEDVKELFDNNGKAVKIQKEGVHFDLAHRNRIEWDPDNLDDFRSKLENRIKAVIY